MRALLECLHIHEANLIVDGDTITCERCGDQVKVVSIMAEPVQWVVRCLQCPYTRYVGGSPALGRLWSSKHLSHTGHSMRVMRTTDEFERPKVSGEETLWVG